MSNHQVDPDPQMGELHMDSSKAPLIETNIPLKETWTCEAGGGWLRVGGLYKLPNRWNRFWLRVFFGARFTKDG